MSRTAGRDLNEPVPATRPACRMRGERGHPGGAWVVPRRSHESAPPQGPPARVTATSGSSAGDRIVGGMPGRPSQPRRAPPPPRPGELVRLARLAPRNRHNFVKNHRYAGLSVQRLAYSTNMCSAAPRSLKGYRPDNFTVSAAVAELVDARASGARVLRGVEVRILSAAWWEALGAR